MNFLKQLRRASVLSVAAFCLSGCGLDTNSGNGGGGGNDGCGADGSSGSCKTVVIDGITWMAENLNRETGGSWCYDNKKSNCGKYGRLYDWNTAMEVCPAGWRLPAAADWDRLAAAAGGSRAAGRNLKSKSGWSGGGDGTDTLKFSALPGGYRSPAGSFFHAGDYGIWWTATEENLGDAHYLAMDYGFDYVIESYHSKSYGRSVRCVKGD
jgi:uncharacterized protein (TIGR02145 family)